MQRNRAVPATMAVTLLITMLTGCTRQPARNAENSSYFGLSGRKIVSPDMNILRNQASLASKSGLNH